MEYLLHWQKISHNQTAREVTLQLGRTKLFKKRNQDRTYTLRKELKRGKIPFGEICWDKKGDSEAQRKM